MISKDKIIHFHNGRDRRSSVGVAGWGSQTHPDEQVASYEVPVTGMTMTALLDRLPDGASLHRRAHGWEVWMDLEDGDVYSAEEAHKALMAAVGNG